MATLGLSNDNCPLPLGQFIYTMVYIPSNTFAAIDKQVLNGMKYYLRSLDFMLIKSRCIIPSSLNNCIEVMLLIAQIMMILRNESMKIKRQFRQDV